MTTEHVLTAEGLSVAFGERQILQSLDLCIQPGKITAVVGANGSGKSTLLRTLSRLIRPQTGIVTLNGESIHRIPSKKLARKVGLLPQGPTAPEGIVVADLVGRGRTPHQGAFSAWSRRDYEVVAESLEAAGVSDLADRSMDELSGGQRQRAWIAMALAQEPDILMLDEPTTFLDIAHQVEVLDLLSDLNHHRGTTIIMVLHDLNLAARYAHNLVAMSDGKIHRSGPPQVVVTESLVHEVFGLDAQIIADPITSKPMVIPIGRHYARNA